MITTSVFDLSGQCALITGGATGLGQSIAQCLATHGAQVILVGRRQDLLRKACQEIGSAAHAFPADITSSADLEDLREKVAASGFRISILVSNAGVHQKKACLDVSKAELSQILETHVLGGHDLIRLFAPPMVQSGRGSILIISSMTAYMGMPNVISYTAAKSALLGMVRAYSSELAPQGVRVNGIAPGWIDSPMLHQALAGDPQRAHRILQRTHLGRFGQPDDIGNAAVFLASPAARFITGTTLVVDGGASGAF